MSHLRPWMTLSLLIGVTGCFMFETQPPPPAEYNFAAHRGDDGVTIDRMEGGKRGNIAPADCPLWCKGPQLLLVSAGETQAAFWLDGTSTIVRSGVTDGTPLLGKVDASWPSDKAIRFSLEPHGDSAYQMGPFQRIDGGYAALSLGQPVAMTLDLTGVYRGELTDKTGTKVGFLRIRVNSVEAPSRLYEGVLPAPLNGPLGAAAVARLDRAIDGILAHATDPFLDN